MHRPALIPKRKGRCATYLMALAIDGAMSAREASAGLKASRNRLTFALPPERVNATLAGCASCWSCALPSQAPSEVLPQTHGAGSESC
jgi:hypothetical protein